MNARKIGIIVVVALGTVLGVSFLLSSKNNATQNKKTTMSATVAQDIAGREAKTMLPPSSQPLEVINHAPPLSDIPLNSQTKISDMLEKGVDMIKQQETPQINTNNGTEQETSSINSVAKPLLSDSQIFEKIWPASYRSDLKKIEDLMVTDHFVKENERSKMSTDQDMFDLYRTFLRYAYTKQYIDEKKYNQF